MGDRTVYVNQLPYSWGDDELKTHLASAGLVETAEIKRHHDGLSRGWGLVTFSTPADAENAVRTLNGTDIQGRTIGVRIDTGEPPKDRLPRGGAGGRGGFGGRGGRAGRTAIRVRSTDPARAVYVRNLAWGVTWRELHKHFQQAGSVIRADVIIDVNGRSKGCGIVEFASPEDAKAAVQQLNGTTLMDRPILVREDRDDGPPRPEQ